jgi:chromosome segregation ATPase
MNSIDLKQTSSPAEMATSLEALAPQLAEWAQALRHVDEVLRASAQAQQVTDETRRRHEHVLAQITEARRTLAELQAEKLQAQADWDANQKSWEAEHHEQMRGLLAERDRLQRELERLRKRRAQGEQALSTLRAVLADARSHLDSMTD